MNNLETAPTGHMSDRMPDYLSDHDFRQAAHATATELVLLTDIPEDSADYPSIAHQLPALPTTQLGEMIRTERYAYASALAICAMQRIITYDPDSPTPERTARIQLVPDDVPPVFATGSEANNPYMRYADRLAASYQAGSDRFMSDQPAKARFLKNTYNALLQLDPSQAATRYPLSADMLATGVEGPPEIAAFLQCVHTIAATMHEPAQSAAYTTQDLTYQLADSLLTRRATLTVPEFRSLPVLAGHADRPDLRALAMDRVKVQVTEVHNTTRYRLDVDGQLTPPKSVERMSPRLQCPVRFVKAATSPAVRRVPNYLDLFIYGAINSAPDFYNDR